MTGAQTPRRVTWGLSGIRGLWFSLFCFIVGPLGQHVAKLCWFLSSCNQAKMYISCFIFFFFSEKVFSLFYIASGLEKSICLILILAYEVFAAKCFFFYCVILSKCYHHCHFQLNNRYFLFVQRMLHILNNSAKEILNAKEMIVLYLVLCF